MGPVQGVASWQIISLCLNFLFIFTIPMCVHTFLSLCVQSASELQVGPAGEQEKGSNCQLLGWDQKPPGSICRCQQLSRLGPGGQQMHGLSVQGWCLKRPALCVSASAGGLQPRSATESVTRSGCLCCSCLCEQHLCSCGCWYGCCSLLVHGFGCMHIVCFCMCRVPTGHTCSA